MLIFFETPEQHLAFQPLSFTRPIADFRLGILKIWQKWAWRLGKKEIGFITQPYLQKAFPLGFSEANLYIQSVFLPNPKIIEIVQAMPNDEGIWCGAELRLFKTRRLFPEISLLLDYADTRPKTQVETPQKIAQTWDMIAQNGTEIRADFEVIRHFMPSQKITDPHTVVYGQENVFVSKGVKMKAAIIDAEEGVVFLGQNCQIGAGSILQNNIAVCENAVLNLGTKLRADITVGEGCKIGGEVKNTIFQDFSNKWHEGYMGNSLIGEWCNFGAGTNSSNMKNTRSNVKIWDYAEKKMIDSGRSFLGLITGDYVHSGIATMFNTGTTVGVGANVFGGDFLPKYIPSFSWGSAENLESYELEKLQRLVEKIKTEKKAFRGTEKDILAFLFEQNAVSK